MDAPTQPIPMRCVYGRIRLAQGPKVYGRVHTRGRVRYRKYAREIRNGLTWAEVFLERQEASARAMREEMGRMLYGSA